MVATPSYHSLVPSGNDLTEGAQQEPMVERKSYTTRELAQMWNVSESTVKRWADTGELKCLRTPGGHRRFTADRIAEFQTRRGFEATGILVEKDGEVPDLDTYLNQRNSDKIRQTLIFLALHNQSGRVTDLLERLHIRGTILADIYDDVILPVLDQLETMSGTPQLSVGQHRLATNNLETALYCFFPKVVRRRPNGNTALCAAPDATSQLLVNASSRVLEAEGWECLNLGPQVPFSAMAQMVEQEPVNLVCLHLSACEGRKDLARQFPTLNRIAENYRIPIVLVGPGREEPEIRQLFQQIVYCPSLRSFRQYVSRFTL